MGQDLEIRLCFIIFLTKFRGCLAFLPSGTVCTRRRVLSSWPRLVHKIEQIVCRIRFVKANPHSSVDSDKPKTKSLCLSLVS